MIILQQKTSAYRKIRTSGLRLFYFIDKPDKIMKKTIIISTITTLLSAIFMQSCDNINDKNIIYNISIPTAGNSWIMDNNAYISSDMITSEGIRNWNDENKTIRTFFYVEKTGKIPIGIRAKVNSGLSNIEIIFNEKSKKITLSDSGYKETYIGDFQIKNVGYYFVDIKGLKKEGIDYADINAILLKTENPESIKYINDDFYFGRRGPSDHLTFEIPESVKNIEWFYSELLIPKDQDVVGSYFMANGFGEGYFGIQVNSLTERRILFSVWSPYKTDNPSDVPEEFKIKLLKKGEGVNTGKFGNEGTGGQSYKIYNWKAGNRYGFLLGAKPTDDGSTDYTAYFYDPDTGNWNLIAQFRRPKTTTYLKRLHSFLENFIPHQGVYERKALYQNQWVYDSSGWHEINRAIFTADNTARKGNRLDYSGGVQNNGFYLKNCGFTNDNVSINSEFERNKLDKEPVINFSELK